LRRFSSAKKFFGFTVRALRSAHHLEHSTFVRVT
jgi:hypothetical protein